MHDCKDGVHRYLSYSRSHLVSDGCSRERLGLELHLSGDLVIVMDSYMYEVANVLCDDISAAQILIPYREYG